MMRFDYPSNTKELVKSLERASTQQTPIDTEILFGHSNQENLEVEIIFITFVTTSVLSVPQTGTRLDTVSIIAVLLLIGTTFIRRLGLDNSFRSTERIYRSTFKFVWGASVFCLIYTVLSLAQFSLEYFYYPPSTVQIFVLWSALLVIILIVTILGYEKIFGDYFLWLSALFYNRFASSDTSPQLLLLFANVCLNMSFYNMNEEHYLVAKIRHHFTGDTDAVISTLGGWKAILVIMLLLSLLPLLFGILASVPFALFSGIGVILSVVSLSLAIVVSTMFGGVLAFFYDRYGTTLFEDVPHWIWVATIVVLTLSIHTVQYAA